MRASVLSVCSTPATAHARIDTQCVTCVARRFTFTAAGSLGLYAGFLALSGVINSFGGRILIITTEAAAWLHIIGVLVLIIAVPCIATVHQPASWVFTNFDAELGKGVGIPNGV